MRFLLAPLAPVADLLSWIIQLGEDDTDRMAAEMEDGYQRRREANIRDAARFRANAEHMRGQAANYYKAGDWPNADSLVDEADWQDAFAAQLEAGSALSEDDKCN